MNGDATHEELYAGYIDVIDRPWILSVAPRVMDTYDDPEWIYSVIPSTHHTVMK